MNTVYLNGQFVPSDKAQVSVFDRGFLFGDSVYEVIPFYQGVGFRLQEHISRLNHSLSAVKIHCNEDWQSLLTQLVDLNGGGNLSVYLQITRGSSGRRTHAYDETLEPTVFACCTPIANVWQRDPDEITPLKAITADDIRWQRCDIKSTCLLPNILLLQQAKDSGADEAILCRDQRFTEGTTCNVFIVKDGVLLTPYLSEEILSGTTRQWILSLAKQAQIPYKEAELDYESLLNADEVWVSSSTRGVIPVTEIDGKVIGNGKKGALWYTMYGLFAEFQNQLLNGAH